MKNKLFFLFKLLFVLVISLATILVNIHPALAQTPNPCVTNPCPCEPSRCPSVSPVKPGTGGDPTRSPLDDLMVRGNLNRTVIQLEQFLQKQKNIGDIIGQAAADQALAEVYTIADRPDLASIHQIRSQQLLQEIGQ